MAAGMVTAGTMPSPLTGLREALARAPLLGFDTSEWGSAGGTTSGQARGKAAFVGGPDGRPPANDEITNAIVIGGTTTTSNESTMNATVSAGESTTILANSGVSNSQSSVGATVWFQYTPITSGQVKFTTDGSNFDTTLQAYTLTNTAQPVSYSNITKLAGASNDDDGYAPPRGSPGNMSNSTITFNAVAGTTYYIQSGGYSTVNGQTATGNLQFSETGPIGIPCYCTGTLIRVVREGVEAEVAVESLSIGDLAVTAAGAHRPIRWIGQRTLDPRRHRDPAAAQPVLVCAHAFGPDRPARDLRVSPGHALCLDLLGEVLVPAVALVNGATVVQEDVARVTYWHIELDHHDILLAENMPAESYLDMGNRGFFAGEGVVDLAARPDSDAAARTHADFCRPFHAAGPFLDVARTQLRARAEGIGWQRALPVPFAGSYLEVDGCRVEPEVRDLSARFVLPAGARDVWLVSPAGSPADVGWSDDPRRMGLQLDGLRLDDGWCAPRLVRLDDPLLCVGFHDVEGEAEAPKRWTAGRSRLPAVLWAGMAGAVTLRLDLACQPFLPQWVEPAPAAERAALCA